MIFKLPKGNTKTYRTIINYFQTHILEIDEITSLLKIVSLLTFFIDRFSNTLKRIKINNSLCEVA